MRVPVRDVRLNVEGGEETKISGIQRDKSS